MLYLRYAEKDIRMLLRSKKMLFNLLFSLSIPTIYMMLASDPVLSSTSTIPLAGMPAFSAIASSILGGELVYFLLINDRESAIDDILLVSNIGKLKLTIVRVMVSCILTIIMVNMALVVAGILNFYSILPMIRVTMWSSNLCISSILNTLLVVLLEQCHNTTEHKETGRKFHNFSGFDCAFLIGDQPDDGFRRAFVLYSIIKCYCVAFYRCGRCFAE